MVVWVVSDSHGSLGTDQSQKTQGFVLQILWHYLSLRKTVGKVSPILVTLTSRSDSNFERSNISLKETKPDGVDWNSNGLDYCVRNNEGKIRWFSADWSGERRLLSKIVLLFNTDKRTLCSKIWRAPTFENSWDFADWHQSLLCQRLKYHGGISNFQLLFDGRGLNLIFAWPQLQSMTYLPIQISNSCLIRSYFVYVYHYTIVCRLQWFVHKLYKVFVSQYISGSCTFENQAFKNVNSETTLN